MQVSIKSFDVRMELKNRGIELEVRDNDGGHLGDLVVTRSRLLWCKGKTTRANGIPVTWARFIAWMEED